MLDPRRPVVFAAVAAVAWGALAAGPVQAAGVGAAPSNAASATEEEEDAPTPAPLTLGSMAVASVSDLAVEAMAVDVAVDHVTYNYRLRNKGKTKLDLAASVAMPDLEVNTDGNTTYTLPAETAENPVNLVVKLNDAPVETTPEV